MLFACLDFGIPRKRVRVFNPPHCFLVLPCTSVVQVAERERYSEGKIEHGVDGSVFVAESKPFYGR
jgi:hypothetical protein